MKNCDMLMKKYTPFSTLTLEHGEKNVTPL